MRKMNDRSFFAGGKSKGSPFPAGVHTKEIPEGMCCGELASYPDTAEGITEMQNAQGKRIKSQALKNDQRY